MLWIRSHTGDQRARKIADRHYNRQKIGNPKFVPPGRSLVLLDLAGTALWITSYPYAEYVRHAWAGAFVCSAFRNEGQFLSSDLIIDAVRCTRHKWPDIPDLGMITFVDQSKVRPKQNPGYCYLKAGFIVAGKTKKGLIALQLLKNKFPSAAVPLNGPGLI